MLGDAFRGNYLNWPGIGEIDIMENINGRPTTFATLHCGVAPGGPCNEFSGIGKTADNATLQDSFHTYAMELDRSIEPNQLRFYLDALNFGTISADQVPAAVWCAATAHGFFVILTWPSVERSPGRNATSSRTRAAAPARRRSQRSSRLQPSRPSR
jgi:hypothetical protein